MKAIFLRIGAMELFNKKINKKPYEILKELGINYKYYIPQTMGDCIDIWCLENISETKYKKLQLNFEIKNPKDFIGYGLSKEIVEEIQNWIDENKLLKTD